MSKLSPEFYIRSDVVLIARELLGKLLLTRFNGMVTGGIIIETEAYAGTSDRASHAYNWRRTKRTEIMYHQGGVAYVYLCYGIHHLFNIVTNVKDTPHAILIRAIKPSIGIEVILQRRKKNSVDPNLIVGPGTVTQALGILSSHTGTDLTGDLIWLEDIGITIPDEKIEVGPRVGVSYAGEDAIKPWRFQLTNNSSVLTGGMKDEWEKN